MIYDPIKDLKQDVARHEKDMDLVRQRILTAIRENLPPGTIVIFRHGQMDANQGEVIRVEWYVNHARITLRNIDTGKERRVPLDSILGVHRP